MKLGRSNVTAKPLAGLLLWFLIEVSEATVRHYGTSGGYVLPILRAESLKFSAEMILFDFDFLHLRPFSSSGLISLR